MAVVATEIKAARVNLPDGFVRKFFTVNGATDTCDLSAHFENIYYVRVWTVADGTDGEVFCTAGTYLPAVTITQAYGASYLQAEGPSVKSTGGST